jgi:hypothetical protein
MKLKYIKLLIIALLSAGILTLTYGGCGTRGEGGDQQMEISDETGDDPEQPDDMGDMPEQPVGTGDPSCQGDAFPDTTATASFRQIECLTDFFIQTGAESMIQCLCDSPETGHFILDIGPSLGESSNIVFEFQNEEVLFLDGEPLGCSSMNITSADSLRTTR